MRPLRARARRDEPAVHRDGSEQGRVHLSVELTREALEGLVDDIVRGTLKIVEQCMTDAGLGREQIDQVILVGGQTRMPLVQQAVAELLRRSARTRA